MKNEQKFIVYKHTSPDGKCYIGKTYRTINERSGKNGRRYDRHSRFRDAIKNIGWENFTHEVLFENLEEEQAKILEISLIHFYKTYDEKYGYNMTLGGDGCSGCHPSNTTKNKISEHRKGTPAWNKGVPMTEEQKKKLSNSHTNSNVHTWYGWHFGKRMKTVLWIEYKNI